MNWHDFSCWFGITLNGSAAVFSIYWFDRMVQRGAPFRFNWANLGASLLNLGILFYNAARLHHG